MKKKWLIAPSIVLALILGMIGLAACGTTTGAVELPSNLSLALNSQQQGVWVSGEGKVTVVPDVAIINLGVEAQAATVAEAQEKATTAMQSVMDELKAQGVAEKDIRTTQFSIYPVRRWAEDRQQEVLIGYRVNNMVTAKVRQVENAGTVIDVVARAGGDNVRVSGISFTVDKPEVYHQEAREKAVADAKAKAEQLAGLAGARLGKPTFISESGGFIPPMPVARMAFESAVPMPAPAPAPISPGETEIRLSVQIAYSLE
ncbi:MAG: SIMPL domain-containing protein [Chloroflexi bacterium]|nr:SIMPL domain-containing protein [Chloroflexota bacterium]